MRANGTRTPREQIKELDRIDHQIKHVNFALDVLRINLGPVGIHPSVGDAWNALHDAVTALEAERRVVELNAPHADATALLVHQNID